MGEKWQIAVYKIHNTNKDTIEVFTNLEDSEKTYKQRKQKLLNKLLIVGGDYKYSAQKLISNNGNGFELFLFYRKHPKAVPDWKVFFKNHVEETEIFHTEPRNMNESFVFFLYHTESKNLYAVAGGYGAFTIQKFIKDDFGIDILVRIIYDKGKRILRHAKEFGVTGGIVGMAKYFRQQYNFYENKNFGNIYREIAAFIDKDTMKNLGVYTDEVRQCIAKNSFKLNHSMDYNEMIQLVSKLNLIIQQKENFSVNDIKLIDAKKDADFIKNLEKKILDKIWENKNDIFSLSESLDFVHKDFEKFLLAIKYKFARVEFTESSILFQSIIQKLTEQGKKAYIKKIHSSNVVSFNENNEELTKDTVFNHLIYEIDNENKSYFLINGKYYQIASSFKTTLNEGCKVFIVSNYDNSLDKAWNSVDEGEYNLKYKGDNNTIVLDTITPENIEPCDILKYDDETIYLYHVKKGFNGSMRDLTNQVFLAANRIIEDLKSDKRYLKSVYEKMQNSKKYKNQIESEEDFLAIFQKRKLCFVLAVKDDGADRSIKNIEQFTSNIAKFALNELIKNMRDLGVCFKITQINSD